ncbi:hypothetical protein CLV35_2607 [Motilibacter peucedani]|uniref:Cell division protein FtsL n=1 Tax=Motilibacter peucedani TaxID=598650 RepID=A0A420XPL5_9ACTN|nr:hypothetical protein [Motilibacter peucedani]RKS74106.1 hypothetical protein CLV35_2607 [Motilibacter peucedani]
MSTVTSTPVVDTPVRTPAAPRPVRPSARRPVAPQAPARGPRLAPFVLLVVGLLAAGLVAMLLLNTVLAQGAFRQARLQSLSATLADEQQRLAASLAQEESPEVLAAKAHRLGLVDSCGPLFLSLRSGRTPGKTDQEDCPGASGAPAAKAAGAAASSKPTTVKPTDKATAGSGKKTSTPSTKKAGTSR